MANKSFLWNTLLSLIGFGVLTMSNFLYSIMTVRMLSAQDFATYNTFFYFLLALPLPAFQLAVADTVSKHHLSPRESFPFVLPALLRLAGLVALFYGSISPLLWYFYGKSALGIVPIGLFILLSWIVIAGLRGLYQGSLQFGVYTLNMSLEGISRFLFGSLFLLLGLKVYGALSASILSGLLGISMLLLPLLFGKKSKQDTSSFQEEILATFWRSLGILFPFGLLVVLDQTVINRFVPEYGKLVNLLSLFGKNLITLSLTVAHVVFAYVLREGEDSFLFRGMGIVTLMFLLASGFAIFFGQWLFGFLFGSPEGYNFLPLSLLYCLPLGVLQLIVNYSIAENYQWVAFSLWGYLALIFLFMIGTSHSSFFSLPFFYGLFGILHGFFVLFVTIQLIRVRSRRSSL